RGGKGLIERISNEARVPVLKHLDGNCHIYIDVDADDAKPRAIAINAKTHRYGTCNTLETVLVHDAVAARLLPQLADAYREKGVELRGCEKSRALVADMKVANEDDWREEYLAPILAVKIVADIDDAMDHISQYSSGHTESIVTENWTRARRF